MSKRLVSVLCSAAFLASSCGDPHDSIDSGASVEADTSPGTDAHGEADAGATGLVVMEPDSSVVLLDRAMFWNVPDLESTAPVAAPVYLESIFWSEDTSCEVLLDPLDDTPGEFIQMFVTVRGARVDAMTELPPTVGDYPIAPGAEMTVRPVVPQTATVAFLLMPTGVAHAVSGVVRIESIDADEAVLSVDAVLEGGRTARGRMTVGRECR